MNPAPILALTSLIGKTNPVGAPFMDGTCENEYWVFAMQMGRLENPCLVYISICFSACIGRSRKVSRVKQRFIVCAPVHSLSRCNHAESIAGKGGGGVIHIIN